MTSEDARAPLDSSRIDWLVDRLEGNLEQGFSSPHASSRYRGTVPASVLRAQGYAVRILPLNEWPAAGNSSVDGADVLVVAKLMPRPTSDKNELLGRRVLDGVRAARAAGTKVVVDICDDAFERDSVDWYWRQLVRDADLCVAASDHLAHRVSAITDRPVVIVGDPTTSPKGQPKVFRRTPWIEKALQRTLGGRAAPQRLRLVWYGHESNLLAACRWAYELLPLAAEHPWSLQLITRESAAVERQVAKLRKALDGAAPVELMHWNEAAQWEAVERADVVLIPTDLDDPTKAVKSSNRLTDALNVGRYVIASPLPSYLPYADHVTLTDSPVQALRDYINAPDRALQRIVSGQALVGASSAPPIIAGHWLAAIQKALALAPREVAAVSAASAAKTPASTSPRETVRLNLGCGDKLLPGYVNVDVAPSRAGKSPDVLCDLRDLSCFPDDHADEILAVHVVEHFWRWEIEAVLREWVRVLRPGGRMVIECPNLRSACEAFLADSQRGARGDRDGQRTMWVFYGDPQWKDPLMVHRWGYTPESLAALLDSVGLVRTRPEPAKYKLREPRDMRVVGEKPSADLPAAPAHAGEAGSTQR
jgi:SAM-dependent methyltransferase